MTGVLHLLDVGVNKPMKVSLRQKWNPSMCSDNHTYTNQRQMRKLKLNTVCWWISEVWQELDPQIIVRAFKKCCISNTLDGSDDDILWTELISEDAKTSNESDVEDCNDYNIIYMYDDDSNNDTPFSMLRDIL